MRRPRFRTFLAVGLATAAVATATVAGTLVANAEAVDETTCAVELVTSHWAEGYTANITITNLNEEEAIEGWELTFNLPEGQKIASSWNADLTLEDGVATAVNKEYNATIAAGGNTSLGFQAAKDANSEDADLESDPSEFALNGVACTTGDDEEQPGDDEEQSKK